MSGGLLMPQYVHNARISVKAKRTHLHVHSARMVDARDDQAERLRQARARAQFSTARAAATRFGWSYDTYSQHERGERGLRRTVAEKYADAFRVSTSWLLTGEGSIDGATPARSVPLISWVSAGRLDMPETVDDLESAKQLSVGDLPQGEWIALEVVGSSMDRISPPGSIILVNRRDRKLVPNGCYVIQIEGEATYKRFRPNPDRFEPVSTDPSHEPIFPAGPVAVIGRVRRSMIEM
jgi:SOS-response transcriptional repressor LexA